MRMRAALLVAAGLLSLAACSPGSKVGVAKADVAPTTEVAATTVPPPAPTEAVPSPPTTVAEPTAPPAVEPGEPIPPDDAVRVTTLANGLTVYVRDNDNPGAQAELRLVVDAGAVLEEADQAGVAHFLEHMLFNGTAKYPANELIDVLQGFGMAFGADVNAYTSSDETVYMLTVPTSVEGNLETGLDVLAEWLSAATIDPDQVIAERGVVLDEWRGDATFDGRVFDTIERLFFTGTSYEGRDPIGTEAAIQAMTAEPLRRFYDRWYRPDNAAVIVVGDIDVGDVGRLVEERFAAIAPRGDGLARPEITVPAIAAPAAAVLADPDAVDAFVELTLPVPVGPVGTTGVWREELLQALAFEMIGTRLADDIRRGVTPFIDAHPDSNSHVRALDAPSVLIDAKAADLRVAYNVLLDEFARVNRFGFNPGEFERSVAGFRSSIDSAFESANSMQDATFADEYTSHFLTGEPIPNADVSHRLAAEVLDSATIEEVNAAFQRRWAASRPHLLIVGPEGADLPTPDEAVADAAVIADRPVDARADESFAAEALMAAPEPVVETATEALTAEPGAYLEPTMLTFANGAKVVINPNEIVEETVVLQARSPGGLSLVAEADVAAAGLMADVMMGSGVGDLDAVQVQALLADTSIEFAPFVEETVEGFAGGASTADLETLLQRLHLAFIAPRFDPAALTNVLSGIRSYAEDPNADPGLASSIALSTLRYGDLPRFRVLPTPAELDAVTTEAMAAQWAQRFAGANDWVFVLAGDLTIEQATEFSRRYIGTLPGTNAAEQWVDHQPDPPAVAAVAEVTSGTGEQAGIRQLYSGPTEGGIAESVRSDLLGTILTARLTDHVREELGASYSPFGFVGVNDEPDLLVETYVEVTGSAEEIERLSEVVGADVADLAANGPTDADMAEAVAEWSRTYDLYSNGEISELLLDAATDGGAIDDFLARGSIVREITRDEMAEFARRVLLVDRRLEVRTRPLA